MAGVNELMNRYGIETAQGMARIIRNHLEALNADGQQHARKIGKEWDLDETAIRCLDEIRGLTRSEAIQNLENAEIRALTEDANNLKTALLHAQNETTEAYKQVQQAQQQILQAQAAVLQEKDRIIAIQEQKAVAETKVAQQEGRIEAMQQDLDRLMRELQQARQETARLQNAAKQHRAEQERLAHASLWQRITGHW